jgi:outer membrane receptor protein involved in Fe transport
VYDAYTVIDAFASYKLAPHTVGTFRVFNLGNEQYAPIFGYPAPGRRFEFELSAS